MNWFKRMLVLVLGLMVIVACSEAAKTAVSPRVAEPTSASSGATSGKPVAIATTTQIEDILSVIVGDKMTVIGLVPRNGDPHEFEPTPGDVQSVANSQAVFKNGVGFEGWIEELVSNAGGERPIFDLSQGVTLGTISTGFEEGGEDDPHIWMNPRNMLIVVDNMVVGLKQLDPANAATYEANATAYKQQLTELDAYAEKELAAIPAERRKLVTAHDAMGYFATRYNFEIVGAVIPSASTEAAETSAQDLAALVDTIRATGVPAIFAEASNNPKFIEQLAQETNVKVDQLYVDSLGEKGSEAGTYLDFFRADVQKIVQALK